MEENKLQDKLMEILELNRETIEKTTFVKLLEKMVEKYEGEKREMDDCLSDRDFINGLDVANNHRGEDVMEVDSRMILWDFEDNLKLDINEEMFKVSKIIDGVRMYPYILIGFTRYYLEDHQENIKEWRKENGF